jgi:ribosomal protein S18 acetylase RimI-like enzyme
MLKNDIALEFANINEFEKITNLVNSVYRGENAKKGWTTEAEIIEGIRITSDKVKEIISSNNDLIITAKFNNDIIGCVHLEKHSDYSILGMLSVDVNYQNAGLGKILISKCEEITKKDWKLNEIRMMVISIRTELIDYYKRRGYETTGKTISFYEIPDAFGNPKTVLYFIELKKTL